MPSGTSGANFFFTSPVFGSRPVNSPLWPPEVVRYKLSDAAEAHRVSEARHLRGKLVFEVR